jgi:hypothetical protein
MKTIGLTLIAVSIIYGQHLSALAQGSLMPPGPPGPTMLTLSQVEPRTPISSAPFTIAKSGSYYLTTNVTVSSGNAIQIEANNVWLDLNGFTISSTASSAGGVAVYIGPTFVVTNVTIMNGFISSGVTNSSSGVYNGSGFSHGVYASGFDVTVKNVSVYGCLDNGIFLGFDSSVVESCTVQTAGNYGIAAQSVSDSTAQGCGNAAIVADTANNCYGLGYLEAISANVANNCFGDGITGNGIFADTANSCYGYCGGSGDGVFAEYIAIGCVGFSTSGAGINALIANSCYSNTGDGAINNKYNMP